MDGTSTTVHHHKLGLTWALLFNACSKDTDLDGLVKFALMSVPGLPLWYPGVTGVGNVDNMVISQDGQQCVIILLSHDQLERHVTVMMNAGYKISHLNVLPFNKKVLFTIVWDRNTTKKQYGIIMDLELDRLHDYFIRMGHKSIRIVFLECYLYCDKVLYICVYEIGVYSSQKVYTICGPQDRCEQRHCDHVTLCGTQGYELMSQSVLVMENTHKLLITTVYEKMTAPCVPIEQSVWLHVPVGEFEEQLAKYTRKKQKLDYFQFYTEPDMVRVGAVWSSCRPRVDKRYHPCRHKSCGVNVYQRHNVSKYGFLFELRETMKTNLRVLFVSAYVSEGVVNLATIWKATIAKAKRGRKKGFTAKKVLLDIEAGLKNTTDFKYKCSPGNSNVHVFSQFKSNYENMETVCKKSCDEEIGNLDIKIDRIELSDDEG